MALLVSTDFTNTVIKVEVDRQPAYIDNDLVTQYWYDLATKYSVESDNLPAEGDINPIVKQYLINQVSIHVSSDNVGSNLREIAEGITVDQWELRKREFESRKMDLINRISADMVWLADPEDGSADSGITMRWSNG